MRTTGQTRWIIILFLALALGGETLEAGAPPARLVKGYGRRPLAFEENRGQTDKQVKFLSRGSGYSPFLTATEAVLALREGTAERTLRLRWVGTDPAPHVSGEEELPGRSHYLLGNDRSKWRTGVPSYGRVRYQGVYPGIDLVFYGNQGQLEYDFVLAPGADPGNVRLDVAGADRMEVDAVGDLVLHLSGSEVRLKKPVSYQYIDGVRREVASGWRQIGKGRLGFKIGDHDPARPLVIDPVLVFSTYLGGSDWEEANGIAVDPQGNTYVTGWTRSPDFPTRGSFPAPLPRFEAFVTKLSPDGSLAYSTYLGGSNSIEVGYAIAVDASGHAYVTGQTDSGDFPLVNPLPPQFLNGGGGIFVSKLDPTGSALVYSTTMGGRIDTEDGRGIAVDAQGFAYIAGSTVSPDFPTVNSLPHPEPFPDCEAFVAKLSPTGSQLVYSTLLGGSSCEEARGIAVDAAGYAYVVGWTQSFNFPTVNAFQATLAGGIGQDAFVAKLAPDASSLLYSTYLGGTGSEFEVSGIVVDPAGNAYVTGYTNSADFPLRNPLQPALAGFTDAYVAKFSPAGRLVYSTYLGGSYLDGGTGIAVDGSGRTVVTGFTASSDFPLKDPLQGCDEARPGVCGSYDAFVTRLSPEGLSLDFSTHLGGTGEEFGRGVAVDAGNAYVTGYTRSSDFPLGNAFQPVPGGLVDAFVTKISTNRPPDCSAATASPATLWPPNGKLVPISIRGVTDPDGDPVTLTVTGVGQDEPLSRRGLPDALGIGTTAVQLRADRAGSGDGRVYRLSFEARDPQGASCSGTVTVCVPRDQRPGAVCGDGGPLFDSTAMR